MKLHPCPKCKTAEHLIVCIVGPYHQGRCGVCGTFVSLALIAETRLRWNETHAKEGTP